MFVITCILKSNVTQPNRCPTETVAQVASVERCNTNVSDHILDRACMYLLDLVTLASPALWRYTEQKMLCKFSVYSYTEHSITTVLLQCAILYKKRHEHSYIFIFNDILTVY